MVIEEVICLIEMGAIAPEDIVKCLRSAVRDSRKEAWVGLTEDEINDLVHNHDDFDGLWEFTDAVESKLREKNT